MRQLRYFDEQTKGKNGYYRILFLDGHISHCSLEFVTYCRDHRIIVITYPPHTTHELQGLDCVPFAALKRHWAVERNRLEKQGLKVSKSNFIKTFEPVYRAAFTEDNIRAAWSRTGIIPFNPEVITEEKMAASKEFSINIDAPAVLDNAYQVILDVASRQLNPVTASVTASVTAPATDLATDPAAASDVNLAIDPALPSAGDADIGGVESAPPSVEVPQLTPTALRVGLANASVGFLIDPSDPFNSDSPVPAIQLTGPVTMSGSPLGLDASVADLLEENKRLREGLLASGRNTQIAQAQLVIHAMYARRLKSALNFKEKRKAIKGRIHLLSNPKARVLTSPEFIAALEEDDVRVKAAEAAEIAMQPERERRAEVAEWRQERDAKCKRKRDEMWQAELARCAVEGVEPPSKKPRLPNGFKEKTPERLKRPPVVVTMEEEDEDEDGPYTGGSGGDDDEGMDGE